MDVTTPGGGTLTGRSHPSGGGDGGYGEGDHGYGGISKNNSGGSGCACSKCGEKGHMATNISQGGGTQEEYKRVTSSFGTASMAATAVVGSPFHYV